MRSFLPSLLLLFFASASFSNPCKTAWKYFKKTDSCYFTGHWETWAEAEDTCRRNDAHLASVHSAEENRWLRGLYSPKTTAPDFTWLGLRRRNGTIKWSDGSPFDFSVWDPTPGNKSCAVQEATSLQWITAKCGLKVHKYVCKKAAGPKLYSSKY